MKKQARLCVKIASAHVEQARLLLEQEHDAIEIEDIIIGEGQSSSYRHAGLMGE
jgi:hypothetical protein